MKRLIVVLCVLCVLLCLVVSCDSQNNNEAGSNKTNSTSSVAFNLNSNDDSGKVSTIVVGDAGRTSETQISNGTADAGSAEDAASDISMSDTETAEPSLEDLMENTIEATITMENGDIIRLELYPDLAPQSVRNFVYLARQGFYDGLKFHRIMKGFMIQGGDPDGDGGGGPGYNIKGEFSSNGFTNELKHTPGILSMARRSGFDTAGSQFFIMHGSSPGLDGDYAAFGQVISGFEIVDKLADIPAIDSNGTVAEKNKPIIKSITIDDDVQLPEPDKL